MIMSIAEYSLHGNELRISGSLDSPLDIRFDIEMRALVDALTERGVAEVVVDIRDVPTIVSQYVGALAAAAAEIKRLGGVVTVRASGRVADVLRECGIGKVALLEVD